MIIKFENKTMDAYELFDALADAAAGDAHQDVNRSYLLTDLMLDASLIGRGHEGDTFVWSTRDGVATYVAYSDTANEPEFMRLHGYQFVYRIECLGFNQYAVTYVQL